MAKRNAPARRTQSKPAAAVDVGADLEAAVMLADQAQAQNTKRAYGSDVAAWEIYAAAAGVELYPAQPDAVAAWIGAMHRDGKAPATIARRCAGLSRWHRDQGEASPTDHPVVRRVLRGVRRLGREKPTARKAALGATQVREALDHLGARDRAILLAGLTTGLRRSELAALRWSDVGCHKSGITLAVRASKTDQEGDGATVALPYAQSSQVCPARTLKAWKREQAGDADALIFPSVSTIARVVKRAAQLVGLDPADFGAHSLRAGMVTTAGEHGVSLGETMQASRHKSADVAASYHRGSDALANQAHRAVVDALVS